MSAREAVYTEMLPDWVLPGEEDPGATKHLNALLDAYRAEVLREAAEKISAKTIATYGHGPGYVRSEAYGRMDTVDELRAMADNA